MSKFLAIEWFKQIWPYPHSRAIVLNEYRAAGAQMRYMLTDIALRGYVFSAPRRVPGDTFGDGINEGRRLLALEILENANIDPNQLRELIARRPTGEAA